MAPVAAGDVTQNLFLRFLDLGPWAQILFRSSDPPSGPVFITVVPFCYPCAYSLSSIPDAIWVIPSYLFLLPLVNDVGVNLDRGNALVSKKMLYSTDVHIIIKKVRSDRMPQYMRSNLFSDPYLLSPSLFLVLSLILVRNRALLLWPCQ